MKNKFGKFGGIGDSSIVKHSNVPKALEYEKRIKKAKIVEDSFFDKKKKEIGFVIRKPTDFQDMHQGIDGFLISINNGKSFLKNQIPFQLKIRNSKDESQNGILIEMIKPWFPSCDFQLLKEKAFTGKDFKCKAELLFSLSSNGKSLRMRKMKEVISNSVLLTNAFLKNFETNKTFVFENQYGQCRIIREKFEESNAHLAGKIQKLVCFLNPDEFKWKKDVEFQTKL